MTLQKIRNLLLNRKARGLKSFAVLVDPDHAEEGHLALLVAEAEKNNADMFFVGGSLITSTAFNKTIAFLKANTRLPVVIFPGSNLHIDDNADAILLLSLISGRNAEFLIGQHVVAAPRLRASGLEVIPTAYLLVDGGKPTTVSYISGTSPIPHDKPEIAAATAMAGEMLGMQLVYADAGSGAAQNISCEMIRKISTTVTCPLVIGGGISSAEKALACWNAGADLLVIGNSIEKRPGLLAEIAKIKPGQ